jgi:hypothetical protein
MAAISIGTMLWLLVSLFAKRTPVSQAEKQRAKEETR